MPLPFARATRGDRMKTYPSRLREFFLAPTIALVFLARTLPSLYAQAPGWTTPIKIKTDTFYTPKWLSMAINHRREVFVVWQQYSEPFNDLLARIYLTRFDGQRWVDPVAITDTLGMDWTPDVAVDTLGYPHLVWGSYIDSEIYYSRFDGLSWSVALNISNNSGESYFPKIAIDHKNNAHVVWHDNSSGHWAVHLRSIEGNSLLPSLVISDTLAESGYPQITLDMKDNIHVSFSARVAPPFDNWEIFYCQKSRGKWTAPTRVTFDTLRSTNSDIAVNSDGLPTLVWDESGALPPVGPTPGYVFTSTLNDSTWTTPRAITDSSYSRGANLSIDGNGHANVVWALQNHQTGASHVEYSVFQGGFWSTPLNLSGTSISAYEGHIVTDDSAHSHVAYQGGDGCIYYTRQTTPVAVKEEHWTYPKIMILEQNYPNPFNSSTTVAYSIFQTTEVSLSVVDVLGRIVTTLQGGHQAPGKHIVRLDCSSLPSGVYFYRLHTNKGSEVKRMVLLR
jgi:hypothetical protein